MNFLFGGPLIVAILKTPYTVEYIANELRKITMKPSTTFKLNCCAFAITNIIALPLHAQIESLVVNTSSDTPQATACTLRAAIETAENSSINNCNPNGIDIDIIDFDDSLINATITLNNELPTVTTNIEINGLGQDNLTISGNDNHRIISVQSGGNLTLSNLTLTDGNPYTDPRAVTPAGGGAISVNQSTLTIKNSNVTGNSIGNISLGSGIFSNESIITISNSTLSDNTATFGGVIYLNQSITNIIKSTISGNNTNIYGSSGIISVNNSSTTINNSKLFNNSANFGNGGAISSYDSNIQIYTSAIFDNYAYFAGAAVNSSNSNITITNSTLSDNRTLINSGAAIYSRSNSVITINNSTISGNLSPSCSAILARGSLNISNSLIVGNTSIKDFDPVAYPCLFDTIVTSQNSLFGANESRYFESLSNFTFNNSNIVLSNQRLDQVILPLADNGGPTLTHALTEGSPAINAGNNETCPDIDQRGVLRNISENDCDIGSYEGFISEESQFIIPLSNGKTIIFSL